MGNIFSILITIIFSVLGGGATLAIVGYMLVVLAQKIYGKIRHGRSFYS